MRWSSADWLVLRNRAFRDMSAGYVGRRDHDLACVAGSFDFVMYYEEHVQFGIVVDFLAVVLMVVGLELKTVDSTVDFDFVDLDFH